MASHGPQVHGDRNGTFLPCVSERCTEVLLISYTTCDKSHKLNRCHSISWMLCWWILSHGGVCVCCDVHSWSVKSFSNTALSQTEVKPHAHTSHQMLSLCPKLNQTIFQSTAIYLYLQKNCIRTENISISVLKSPSSAQFLALEPCQVFVKVTNEVFAKFFRVVWPSRPYATDEIMATVIIAATWWRVHLVEMAETNKDYVQFQYVYLLTGLSTTPPLSCAEDKKLVGKLDLCH